MGFGLSQSPCHHFCSDTHDYSDTAGRIRTIDSITSVEGRFALT